MSDLDAAPQPRAQPAQDSHQPTAPPWHDNQQQQKVTPRAPWRSHGPGVQGPAPDVAVSSATHIQSAQHQPPPPPPPRHRRPHPVHQRQDRQQQQLPAPPHQQAHHGQHECQQELVFTGRSSGTFEQFVRASTREELVDFFRDVLRQLEGERGLQSFHFKVTKNWGKLGKDGWSVVVYYGGPPDDEDEAGPLRTAQCMSCDLTTPLATGVLGSADAVAGTFDGGAGPTAADSLMHETEHCRVWLDAKARPMLVLTPKPHLERLSEMSDDQLEDLWRSAVASLDSYGIQGFQSMIVNHGDNRNHAHVHLKVRVQAGAFERAAARWEPDLQRKLGQLRCFAAALPEDRHAAKRTFHAATRQQQQGQQEQQQPAAYQHHRGGSVGEWAQQQPHGWHGGHY